AACGMSCRGSSSCFSERPRTIAHVAPERTTAPATTTTSFVRVSAFTSPRSLASGYHSRVRKAHLFLAFAGVAALLALAMPRPARAFGEVGAFDPRILATGAQTNAARPSAPARWAWELVQRTSAPARLKPSVVRADEQAVTDAPFLYWSGDTQVAPL